MVSIKNLSVKIKNTTILNSISATLEKGRITSFIGPSGAGKTTLLKSMVGLIEYQEGTITLNKNTLKELSNLKRAQKIGFVFQNFNLFPHLNVLKNCMDPLLIRGISVTEAKNVVINLLRTLGLEKYRDSYPCQLSGGQQQRCPRAHLSTQAEHYFVG